MNCRILTGAAPTGIDGPERAAMTVLSITPATRTKMRKTSTASACVSGSGSREGSRIRGPVRLDHVALLFRENFFGDRVWFAGEACSEDDWATVAGAHKSGVETAQALHERLE